MMDLEKPDFIHDDFFELSINSILDNRYFQQTTTNIQRLSITTAKNTMILPQSRAFITSLINSLNPSTTATTTTPPTSNPLKQASPATRSILLTLHVLYPNELLSALDLLDRDLITRLIPLSKAPPPTNPPTNDTTIDQEPSTSLEDQSIKTKDYENAIYYVRSAQQTTSKSRFRDPLASSTHYEVRTSSWSCSCPAFVFSAFPPGKTSLNEGEEDGDWDEDAVMETEDQEWKVGGLSLGEDVPMCKHLLACVLAERGGLFEGYVKTREVSVEELAGWAAGWGD
jgi:hypothetical protein